MSLEKYRPQRRSSDELHSGLYGALALFALWYVFAAWSFGGGAYTDYLLTVASGLIAITIVIPVGLWRIWRSHSHDDEGGRDRSFRAWAASELHIWQDHVRGRNAAIEVLLPVAAVAFGMTIFGIIVHFTPH